MLLVDVVILGVSVMIMLLIVTSVYAWLAGIPSVPTPRSSAQAMVRLARLRGSERVFDIGAGHGRILIEAKRLHPGITAVGIEYSPTVWLLGRLTVLCSRQQVTLLCGDGWKTDLRDADALFLYLSPKLMASLEDKLDRELRPGTVVIAHAFRFSRRQPKETIIVQTMTRKQTLMRYEW